MGCRVADNANSGIYFADFDLLKLCTGECCTCKAFYYEEYYIPICSVCSGDLREFSGYYSRVKSGLPTFWTYTVWVCTKCELQQDLPNHYRKETGVIA